jgi:hypothetical protein
MVERGKDRLPQLWHGLGRNLGIDRDNQKFRPSFGCQIFNLQIFRSSALPTPQTGNSSNTQPATAPCLFEAAAVVAAALAAEVSAEVSALEEVRNCPRRIHLFETPVLANHRLFFSTGRGGFQREGPPAQVLEMGTFMHACEDEIVCESINPKVPHFNAQIFLENKVCPIGGSSNPRYRTIAALLTPYRHQSARLTKFSAQSTKSSSPSRRKTEYKQSLSSPATSSSLAARSSYLLSASYRSQNPRPARRSPNVSVALAAEEEREAAAAGLEHQEGEVGLRLEAVAVSTEVAAVDSLREVGAVSIEVVEADLLREVHRGVVADFEAAAKR